MAKNITEVVIAGKIISISGDEDAAYMSVSTMCSPSRNSSLMI